MADETHDRAHQGQAPGCDQRRVLIGPDGRRLAVPRTGRFHSRGAADNMVEFMRETRSRQ
jgi:hypothetical protein